MAHPYNSIREDKVAKSRVAKISRASGGGVHSDEAADKSLVKSMVKRTALKMEGGAAMARGDRPNRASGGRVKKTSKGTTVNVIVAPIWTLCTFTAKTTGLFSARFNVR